MPDDPDAALEAIAPLLQAAKIKAMAYMADDAAPGIYSKLHEARNLLGLIGETHPNLSEVSQGLVERMDDLLTLSPGQLEAERLNLDKAATKIARAWMVLFDEPPPAATKSLKRGGISGLSAKDVVLLLLVTLLLMHGGDGHPTALGEAIESNDLQVVAIVIALAAYLRKRD